MEYVMAAVLGLAGLAYAVKAGRRARRLDLTEDEQAAIRRARERTLVTWKVLTGISFAFALILLTMGRLLPALIMGLSALIACAMVVYVRRLLKP